MCQEVHDIGTSTSFMTNKKRKMNGNLMKSIDVIKVVVQRVVFVVLGAKRAEIKVKVVACHLVKGMYTQTQLSLASNMASRIPDNKCILNVGMR